MGQSTLRGSMRRLVPAGLSALMALGLLVAPSPRTARAEPLPTYPVIYITPDCFTGGDVETLTISGRNFERNTNVIVTQSGFYGKSDKTVYPVTDDFGVFSATLVLSIDPYSPNIRLDALYSFETDPVAYGYAGPCSSGNQIELIAVGGCGDADNPSIHVTGERFGGRDVGGDIRIELRDESGYALGDPLTIPASESFDVTWQPGLSLAAGQYEVYAGQNAINYEYFWSGSDSFMVPCPQATIDPVCVPNAGSPPDRMSIMISGTGWLQGTADGYDELEIVFDPDNEPQEFYFSANPYEGETGIREDGSVGPLEINPYARPDGVYKIQVKQQGYGVDPIVEQFLTFTVPCTTPTLTADPPCGAPELLGDVKQRYLTTVTGSAFYPNEDVTVVFDADYAAGSDFPPEYFYSVVEQDGTFTVSVDAAYRPPGAYRIYAYEETRYGTFQAYAAFPVPCIPPVPTLVIDPTCGAVATTLPLAYTINITGSGFAPGRVDIVFDPTGLVPETGTAFADDKGFFTLPVQFNGRQPGAYLIVASQTSIFGLLDQFSIPFPVTCEGAILRISPTSGARGFVPMVEGFNFRPSTTLYLFWDYGIGATQPMKVDTDENGSFRRQVVIYRSDFSGLRHLTVQLPEDPLAYAVILVDYLVTPTTVSPPFKVEDNPFAGPDATIVLRR